MASVLKPNSGTQPSDPTPSAFSGLASVNLDDFVETTSRQLASAKAEADRIIAEAKRQAEQLRENTLREARAEGLALGKQDFNNLVEESAKKMSAADLTTLRQAVDQLWTNEQSWLEQWQLSLIGMVLELTERLVGKRIQEDETILLQWAKEAIELTRTARSITVALHPETLVRIGDHLEPLLRSMGAPEDSRLEADETVSINGVVVRQVGGKVDMQLKTQMQRIEAFLK
jgi:flagellar assembly protein FliH